MDGTEVLRVRGLTVTVPGPRGPVAAVRDVDVDVRRGELVALLGESGSGKSLTARAVMGVLDEGVSVVAGSVHVGATDVLGAGEQVRRRLRGERMSLVLQDALSALNPVLSVGEQIGELFRVHRGSSRRAARGAAADLLGTVGIPAPARRVDDHPHQFSGGMRQRILIAMAIALEPELLIADEPTTALDVTVQAQILDLLQRLRTERDMGVLLITHDLGVVTEVADRVVVMYAGRVVEQGDADDVLTRPAHPYTVGLLRSVPQGTVRGARLPAIPGSPPPAGTPVPGCSFHPRCPWAVTACRTRRPVPVEVGPGRSAACHRSEEVLGALPV